MKLFAILASLAVMVKATPSCDECLASVDGLIARVTGEASLAEQAAILIATLCPQVDAPADCESGIAANWAAIGTVLFPEFLQGDAVCGANGLCKEITCEDCQAGIAYIVGLMNDADQIAAAVEYMSGDAFCQSGNSPDPVICAANIALLIPNAMPVLGAAFVETQNEICQDVNGVC